MGQATANQPPLARGVYQTLDAGVSEAQQPFNGILGSEWEFPDVDYASTALVKPLRSGGTVRCRLVRNNKGSAVLPKQLVAINPLDPGDATGLAASASLEAYPVDEFVPAAGVPDNAICWVVVRGRANCIYAATVTADVTAGDFLNPSAVTQGALDIVNSFTANKALFNNIKGARFKATANATAVSSGGATVLVEVMP